MAGKQKTTAKKQTVEIRRVDDPQYRANVDAETYEAVKSALLAAMAVEGGADIHALHIAVGTNVASHLVPIRKVNMWTERVCLDLEAKGLVVCDREGPRWRRT